MRYEHFEAIRNFPHVYACATISLLNHFPIFCSFKGRAMTLEEMAAEITLHAVDNFVNSNHIELNTINLDPNTRIRIVQYKVLKGVDYSFVNQRVKQFIRRLIVSGQI